MGDTRLQDTSKLRNSTTFKYLVVLVAVFIVTLLSGVVGSIRNHIVWQWAARMGSIVTWSLVFGWLVEQRDSLSLLIGTVMAQVNEDSRHFGFDKLIHAEIAAIRTQIRTRIAATGILLSPSLLASTVFLGTTRPGSEYWCIADFMVLLIALLQIVWLYRHLVTLRREERKLEQLTGQRNAGW